MNFQEQARSDLSDWFDGIIQQQIDECKAAGYTEEEAREIVISALNILIKQQWASDQIRSRTITNDGACDDRCR